MSSLAPCLRNLALLVAVGCTSPMSQSSWRTDVKVEPPPAAPRAAEVPVPEHWVWHPRTRLPATHSQACDLVSTPSGLVVAAASEALEKDGAALFRLQPDGSLARLFEWGGQGFLRVLAFGNRLLVPDGDPPFSALSFVFSWDVDG
ncbi:hypothetical protein ACLESO_01920 [Pyxidicoccus sp. 3LG]